MTNLVTTVIGFTCGALRDHLILPKVMLFGLDLFHKDEGEIGSLRINGLVLATALYPKHLISIAQLQILFLMHVKYSALA